MNLLKQIPIYNVMLYGYQNVSYGGFDGQNGTELYT